jgi:hypothetical protein
VRLEHPTSPCFVSYARPDEELARALVQHLEAKGADVWWDLNSLRLGAPLGDALSTGVEDADVLFLIATPAANQSAYVRFELEQAARRGLRTVPVRTDDREAAFAAALSELRRTPAEQLRWLQSRPSYSDMRARLDGARRDA